MSHIKTRWQIHIENADSGRVIAANNYFNEKNYTETTSSLLWTRPQGLQPGTIISADSFLDKSNPYASHAINKSQKGKTVSDEKLNEPEKALKFDEGKPDLSQVSPELMEHVALVRMFGEKKYARNNWKKGFKVTRSLAAALRHIFAVLRGELYDPESGLYHVAHAICCLEHCLYDMIHNKENIDV